MLVIVELPLCFRFKITFCISHSFICLADGRIIMATLFIMAGSGFLVAFGNHQSVSKLLLRSICLFQN